MHCRETVPPLLWTLEQNEHNEFREASASKRVWDQGMISFTPKGAANLEADSCAGDVWILHRLNHQSCLIIGVFESSEAAFAYTAQHGPIDRSGWIEPHPGQRRWEYENDKFTYFLEKHRVRHANESPYDIMLNSGLLKR
jgi:hypothetical protein